MSDTIAPAEGHDTGSGPSADLERFKEWHKAARDHRHDWSLQAKEDFGFVSGDHWSEEDLHLLREQMRPIVTFNRIGPFLDSVEGHEINNRTETRYIPRQIGASGVNDLLTAAAKWCRDECDAEDEETSAFTDMVACGEGWTETKLDYTDDPDGMIEIERVDPLEMLPDPASRKQNYADARYLFRVKQVAIEAAREQWPGFSDEDLDAGWANDDADHADDPHDARAAPFYRNDQSGEIDRERQRVTIVEVQWYDYQTAYRVQDPATGRMQRLTQQQHAALQDRWKQLQQAGLADGPVKSVRDRIKRYHKAVLGSVILQESPGPEKGGFTWKAMTAKRDRNKGHWYGIVRAMKDPQRWANKWLSQTMHVINTNAKGGIMAEEDAFSNPSQAEDSWSASDSITWTNPGAIVQGKIRDKPPITYPAGLDNLMQFALSSIPAVTGINPEMLGQTTTMQPQAAALEAGRKQQAMSILAGLFNAKRRYCKEQGRLLLWFIQTFIADGRLVRVGGAENAQYVPLIHDPRLGEMDVIVDDGPTSTNAKEKTWGMLMALLPVIQRLNLPPQAMLEMFKYSPLPTSLVAKLGQMAMQAASQPQNNPQQAVDQAKAMVHHATAQKLSAEAQSMPMDMQMKAAKAQADIEAARAAAIFHLTQAKMAVRGGQLDEAQAAIDSLLEGHQQGHDQAMAQQGAATDQAAQQQQQAMAAQQQAHDQALAIAQHQLAVQQAQQDAQQPSPSA